MSRRTIRHAKSIAHRLDRRRFGQALGVGLICAPFVRLLQGKEAVAAPGSAKRVVFVMTGGTSLDDWRLTGSSDLELVTNSWNDGLDRIKDKAIVMENLDGGDGAHGSYHCLVPSGSSWGGPSLERLVADHHTETGVASSLPQLLLGSQVADGMSYFRNKGASPTIDSPSAALALVFGGVNPDSEASDAELQAALARKQSMLDTVRTDLNELHQMLGAEERPKLEEHLDSLRQYELRLTDTSTVTAGCQVPELVDSTDAVATAQSQMMLAHATLACDISRVVGVAWGQHNQFNLNLPDIDVVDDLHSLHHGPNKRDKLGRYESWFSHQFADFVESFASTADPETGGSLLDSTLICWVRGMGDAIGHSSRDSRLVLAGGANILQTNENGRYIDAGGQDYKKGLACIGEALGLGADVLDGHTPIDGVLA